MRSGRGAGDRDERSFIETARRAQIVQAAVETIAEVGYAKASFRAIAARAGISPSLISYHFRSKAELVEQVLDDLIGAMDAAIDAEVEGSQSWTAALRAVIRGQVRYFDAHRTEVLALGQLLQVARGDDGGLLHGPARRQQDLAELDELFRGGQAAGEFRPAPVRVLSATLLAALEAVPTQLFADPDLDVEAYAEELATIFERAVAPC